MEPFELNDREWNDVLELINQQIKQRSLEGEPDAFAQVFKLDWGIITDQSNRDRMLLHNSHRQLTRHEAEQTTNLAATTASRLALQPDPGPPTRRP